MGNAVASGGCRCLWGYSGQDVARAVAAFRERAECEGPGVGFLVGGGEDARAVAHRGPLALSGEEAAAVAAAVAAARARVERLRKVALVEQLRAAEAAGRGADPNGKENREPTLELSPLRADDGDDDGNAGAGECAEAEAAGRRRGCGCGWPACPFDAPGGSPLDGFQLLCCLISFSCQQDEEKLASLFDLFDFERRGSLGADELFLLLDTCCAGAERFGGFCDVPAAEEIDSVLESVSAAAPAASRAAGRVSRLAFSQTQSVRLKLWMTQLAEILKRFGAARVGAEDDGLALHRCTAPSPEDLAADACAGLVTEAEAQADLEAAWRDRSEHERKSQQQQQQQRQQHQPPPPSQEVARRSRRRHVGVPETVLGCSHAFYLADRQLVQVSSSVIRVHEPRGRVVTLWQHDAPIERTAYCWRGGGDCFVTACREKVIVWGDCRLDPAAKRVAGYRIWATLPLDGRGCAALAWEGGSATLAVAFDWGCVKVFRVLDRTISGGGASPEGPGALVLQYSAAIPRGLVRAACLVPAAPELGEEGPSTGFDATSNEAPASPPYPAVSAPASPASGGGGAKRPSQRAWPSLAVPEPPLTLVVVGRRGYVEFFQLGSGQRRRGYCARQIVPASEYDDVELLSVAVHAESRLALAGGSDGHVYVWEGLRLLRRVRAHAGQPVRSLVACSRGFVSGGGADGVVHQWSSTANIVASFDSLGSAESLDPGVKQLCWSRCGELVSVVTNANELFLLSGIDGANVSVVGDARAAWTAGHRGVCSLQQYPERGLMLSVGSDAKLKLWALDSAGASGGGVALVSTCMLDAPGLCVAAAPLVPAGAAAEAASLGHQLVAFGGRVVRGLRAGWERAARGGNLAPVLAPQDPAGPPLLVAVGLEGGSCVLERNAANRTWGVVFEFSEPGFRPRAVALSPCGRFLCAGDRLFDLKLGAPHGSCPALVSAPMANFYFSTCRRRGHWRLHVDNDVFDLAPKSLLHGPQVRPVGQDVLRREKQQEEKRAKALADKAKHTQASLVEQQKDDAEEAEPGEGKLGAEADGRGNGNNISSPTNSHIINNNNNNNNARPGLHEQEQPEEDDAFGILAALQREKAGEDLASTAGGEHAVLFDCEQGTVVRLREHDFVHRPARVHKEAVAMRLRAWQGSEMARVQGAGGPWNDSIASCQSAGLVAYAAFDTVVLVFGPPGAEQSLFLPMFQQIVSLQMKRVGGPGESDEADDAAAEQPAAAAKVDAIVRIIASDASSVAVWEVRVRRNAAELGSPELSLSSIPAAPSTGRAQAGAPAAAAAAAAAAGAKQAPPARSASSRASSASSGGGSVDSRLRLAKTRKSASADEEGEAENEDGQDEEERDEEADKYEDEEGEGEEEEDEEEAEEEEDASTSSGPSARRASSAGTTATLTSESSGSTSGGGAGGRGELTVTASLLFRLQYERPCIEQVCLNRRGVRALLLSERGVEVLDIASQQVVGAAPLKLNKAKIKSRELLKSRLRNVAFFEPAGLAATSPAEEYVLELMTGGAQVVLHRLNGRCYSTVVMERDHACALAVFDGDWVGDERGSLLRVRVAKAASGKPVYLELVTLARDAHDSGPVCALRDRVTASLAGVVRVWSPQGEQLRAVNCAVVYRPPSVGVGQQQQQQQQRLQPVDVWAVCGSAALIDGHKAVHLHEPRSTLTSTHSEVGGVALSVDRVDSPARGMFATFGARDASVCLWDERLALVAQTALVAPVGAVCRCAMFSHNGAQIAVGTSKGTVHVLSVPSLALEKTLTVGTGATPIAVLAWAPDRWPYRAGQKPNEKNRLCVARDDGSLFFYDCRLGLTKRPLVGLDKLKAPPKELTFAEDCEIVRCADALGNVVYADSVSANHIPEDKLDKNWIGAPSTATVQIDGTVLKYRAGPKAALFEPETSASGVPAAPAPPATAPEAIKAPAAQAAAAAAAVQAKAAQAEAKAARAAAENGPWEMLPRMRVFGAHARCGHKYQSAGELVYPAGNCLVAHSGELETQRVLYHAERGLVKCAGFEESGDAAAMPRQLAALCAGDEVIALNSVTCEVLYRWPMFADLPQWPAPPQAAAEQPPSKPQGTPAGAVAAGSTKGESSSSAAGAGAGASASAAAAAAAAAPSRGGGATTAAAAGPAPEGSAEEDGLVEARQISVCTSRGAVQVAVLIGTSRDCGTLCLFEGGSRVGLRLELANRFQQLMWVADPSRPGCHLVCLVSETRVECFSGATGELLSAGVLELPGVSGSPPPAAGDPVAITASCSPGLLGSSQGKVWILSPRALGELAQTLAAHSAPVIALATGHRFHATHEFASADLAGDLRLWRRAAPAARTIAAEPQPQPQLQCVMATKLPDASPARWLAVHPAGHTVATDKHRVLVEAYFEPEGRGVKSLPFVGHSAAVAAATWCRVQSEGRDFLYTVSKDVHLCKWDVGELRLVDKVPLPDEPRAICYCQDKLFLLLDAAPEKKLVVLDSVHYDIMHEAKPPSQSLTTLWASAPDARAILMIDASSGRSWNCDCDSYQYTNAAPTTPPKDPSYQLSRRGNCLMLGDTA